MASMAGHRYQLTARLFRGSLSAPVRNETQTAEGDDRGALEEVARDLSGRGFSVWLSERRDRGHGQSSFHVLTEWHPTDQPTEK